MPRDLRSAARSVRAAELGRAAERRLRPRELGPTRSRPPLPVLLRLAAVRGLLVWESPAAFVLLDPPVGWRPGPVRARLAAAVDEWWPLLVLLSVPVAALPAAVVAVLAGAPALLVLALVLAAVTWVALCLTAGVPLLAQGLRFTRADLTRATLYPHWRLALVHAPADRVQPLVAAALRRVDELAAADPESRRLARAGVQQAETAATTTAARDAVRALSPRPGPRTVDVSVVRPPAHHTEPPVGAGGIGVILLGLAAVLAVLPVLVAGSERAACADAGCAGRPATYGSALGYLLRWLTLGIVPSGAHAATVPAKAFAALMVPLGVVVAGCVVLALVLEVGRRRNELAAARREVGTADSRIFLNYRREDEAWVAAIDRHLTAVFGPVFRDTTSIVAGADFPATLLAAVRRASVLVAVIGPGWLAADPAGRRRIDDPRDWVRRELVAAFEAGIPVVPVLVAGAGRLTDADLPAELEPLRTRQDVVLHRPTDPADLTRLADELDRAVPDLRRR